MSGAEKRIGNEITPWDEQGGHNRHVLGEYGGDEMNLNEHESSEAASTPIHDKNFHEDMGYLSLDQASVASAERNEMVGCIAMLADHLRALKLQTSNHTRSTRRGCCRCFTI